MRRLPTLLPFDRLPAKTVAVFRAFEGFALTALERRAEAALAVAESVLPAATLDIPTSAVTLLCSAARMRAQPPDDPAEALASTASMIRLARLFGDRRGEAEHLRLAVVAARRTGDAAQAALAACRNAGFQVTVAVVDRAGIAQVVMRDRLAGAHTVDMAVDKAWTEASFRTSTSALAKATEQSSPQSGIRNRPRVAAVAGGLTMESAGALVGAIGVSGAPGGDRDEACALEGIAAVRDSLERPGRRRSPAVMERRSVEVGDRGVRRGGD